MRHEEAAYLLGYRVTEDGRVLGLSGNERKLQINAAGYYRFSYRKDKPQIRVHRLQAYQKYGVRLYEAGMVVRHLDGNPENNSASNIEIGTQSQNMQDRDAAVRKAHAKKAASFLRRLTDEQVIAIRVAYASGVKGIVLAKQYEVSKSTISWIACGKLYSEVGGPIAPPKKCVRKKNMGRGTA